uniref:B-cell receptor CD22 n=1 Tax=Electrophorus electricus TaxID=8005 RepID=A0A4W4GUQ6_ELEEL
MGVIHLKSEWLWTSLVLSGVLAGDWAVHVPKHPIHASRGSSVTLLCTYDFPEDSVLGGPPHKVLSEMWCRNQSFCITPTYIYHSAGIFPEPAYQGRVRYLGTTGSKNCTLQITDLRTTDSGIYVFRFITDHPVNGPVTSVTVISTGEIAEGSSLTLTCTSYSTSPVMNYTWFKTNGAITSLRGSGQNFSIERLSSKDSGLYTCMAQNSSPVTFIGIVCGLALALTVITIIAAYRR